MNKRQLEERIRRALGGTATHYAARMALDAVVSALREGLHRDGEVRLAGFGSFRMVTRRPRRLLLPRTGAEHQLPERRVLVFHPSPQTMQRPTA
ncbi:MAG: HU family DNA-binding protein [Akkermansia sp.]